MYNYSYIPSVVQLFLHTVYNYSYTPSVQLFLHTQCSNYSYTHSEQLILPTQCTTFPWWKNKNSKTPSPFKKIKLKIVSLTQHSLTINIHWITGLNRICRDLHYRTEGNEQNKTSLHKIFFVIQFIEICHIVVFKIVKIFVNNMFCFQDPAGSNKSQYGRGFGCAS